MCFIFRRKILQTLNSFIDFKRFFGLLKQNMMKIFSKMPKMFIARPWCYCIYCKQNLSISFKKAPESGIFGVCPAEHSLSNHPDPNLYVEYGNMIHFAENAWTSVGRLNVGIIHHQIGSVFSDISKVQSLTVK